MDKILISPPLAFLILLGLSYALSLIFGLIAYRPKEAGAGKGTSYACGEGTYDNMAQPDYSYFFPYAFFFTIAHVATLIVATIPAEDMGIIITAAVYISSVIAGLFILLGKD